MWLFDLSLDPQLVMLAQVVIEALLVIMVAALLWRQGRSGGANEGAIAASENLLRRLEEKRRTLEGAMEAVRAKDDLMAPHRPEPTLGLGQKGAKRPSPLERAAALAARGMSSAEISRQLGVPRGEVEMFLSLREGMHRQA